MRLTKSNLSCMWCNVSHNSHEWCSQVLMIFVICKPPPRSISRMNVSNHDSINFDSRIFCVLKSAQLHEMGQGEIMRIHPDAAATTIHAHRSICPDGLTSQIDRQFWCLRLESNPIWILQYLSDETSWVGLKFNEIQKKVMWQDKLRTRLCESIHPATATVIHAHH